MEQGTQPLLSAKGLIFDVDGTLVDSVDAHAEAWWRAFADWGYRFDKQAIRSQIGKGGDQLMPVFLPPDVLKRQGEAIEAYRKGLFAREYLQGVRGFPQVSELFAHLRRSGKKLALGSSAKKDELTVYETIAGIKGLTDAATTADDASRSKPHPDIFEAALTQLGLPADEVVAVGDSPHDVEAAKRAGMKTVGLLCGGFPERDLVNTGAVAIFRDPADLLQALRREAGPPA